MMKVIVKHGLSTRFEVEVPDDSTLETVLADSTVVSVCGAHNCARIEGAEVSGTAKIQAGVEVEPFTKADEKG